MLSDAEPAKPQRKNVANADARAEKHVVEFAENFLYLLSDNQPKKVDEMIPGTLNLLKR